ncbi:MAG TPA: DUF3617 domain-containing protein [Burkholderiales bacterium]|nr:DUF3617 domain-containing protein [Burkholderiales bacterium]
MSRSHAVATIAALLFAGAASAQSMKPGLWEVTNNMKSSNPATQNAMAQAQAQMKDMSPQQRKMVEDMMAKQGMQMGMGPAANSMRVCMTKEMVDRNEMPAQQGGCRTTQQSRSGNTLKMAFQCANPPSSGEGEYTFVSPESYRMRMTVRTSVQGKPETMNMDGTGKWISSDCGNIKPMRPPGK